MKKIYLSIIFASLSFALLMLNACKKMDSTYEKFLVPGGLTYPAQVLNPLVYAGKNRIKISWLKSSDPNLVKARVFWNNYTDSLEVPISPNQDTISIIINDLEERAYSFYVRTYDEKGNASVPTELIGESFGDQYQESLLSRPINRGVLFDDGKVEITWGAANLTGGAYASEVLYTNRDGKSIKKIFSTEDATSQLVDLKEGSKVQFRTIYLPDSLAIDTFYTAYDNFDNFYFDKSTWKVVAYSSQHDGSDANKVENIIDGTYTTRWHCLVSSNYPHFVVIDMQNKKNISSFSVERTTFDNPGGDDRGPDTFQLFVSDDNETWKDLGIYNFNRLLNGEQFYPMSPIANGRYFKFVGLTGPQSYMVLGEISVYGY